MTAFRVFLLFLSFLIFRLVAPAQSLDATIDFARFRASDSTSLLEFYTTFSGNSVAFKKVDPNSFQAVVNMEIQVTDSKGNVRYFDKILLKSPVTKDTAGSKPSFNFKKRLLLPNDIYTLRCKAKDANLTHPETIVEFPVEVGYKSDRAQVSDIQFLESFSKTNQKNDYTKHGFLMVPYVSAFFPKEINSLKFYSEFYHTDKTAGAGEPIVVYYRVHPVDAPMGVSVTGNFKKETASRFNVLLAEVDLSEIPSGNYELIVEARNKQNKIIAFQKKFFQRSNPALATAPSAREKDQDLTKTFASRIDTALLSDYLLYHLPIARDAESSTIQSIAKSGTLAQKQEYLYNFWTRRSELDAEIKWLEYKQRVDYVRQTFSNRTFKGFETDRGRVYLQYGAPSQVHTEQTDVKRNGNREETRPYQIWHYYHLENQSNKEFIFVQNNLGNTNYRLVHSNARGEISNPNWRQEMGRRFSKDDPGN